jgi:hypothetical protein
MNVQKGASDMSIERVKEHFRAFGKEQDILEFTVSSATVELAAAAISVNPARIWAETAESGDGQAS